MKEKILNIIGKKIDAYGDSIKKLDSLYINDMKNKEYHREQGKNLYMYNELVNLYQEILNIK